MAVIDLTLQNLLVPDIVGYTPPFGTKVTRDNTNLGGLSTAQVNTNVLMAFAKMRPVPIVNSSETTTCEYDAKLVITSEDSGVNLRLDKADYTGCTLTIYNTSSVSHWIARTLSGTGIELKSKATLYLVWDGTQWIETNVRVSLTQPENLTEGDIWIN